MQMAVHIGEAPTFEPLVPYSKSVPEIRWGKSRAMKFCKLLREFWIDAQCDQFFNQQIDYYQKVIDQFQPIYDSLDIDWYAKFYGNAPEEKFRIVVAPGIGGQNYGPRVIDENGNVTVYAVMGVWNFDTSNNPEFIFEDHFPILLHEFNHSFVNPLLPQFRNQLEPSCSELFEKVKTEMSNQSYGDWEVMYNESVVRAAVVQYMIDHNFDVQIIDKEFDDNYYRGFIWMIEVVDALLDYSKNRITYPKLYDYYPKLIAVFDAFYGNIEQHMEKYNDSRPKISSITEFQNGATIVDPNLKTIAINFDQEMDGIGYSINYGDYGTKGYPEMKKIYYSEDKRSLILEVELKEHQNFEFIILGRGFQSSQRVPIIDYKVSFETK